MLGLELFSWWIHKLNCCFCCWWNMASSVILDCNSFICVRINQLEFEFLIPSARGGKPWHRRCVDNRIKYKFKASILRYFEEVILHLERKFKVDVANADSNALGMEKLPLRYYHYTTRSLIKIHQNFRKNERFYNCKTTSIFNIEA